ncbi:MAG: type II toxin-antitoxin system RelE/ParE family toxin [Dehalococcoidia bacterium]
MNSRFWVDARGRMPVREYLEALERHGEAGALATFGRVSALVMADGPAVGMPHTRLIDRRFRLHEMRFGSHRIAYVVHDGDLVLLHAWRKRSQKLDTSEAEVARRRLRGIRDD